MGITQLSLDRINRYIHPNSKILIIGCQNLYDADHYMQVAHHYFESLGHIVRSLDILGCQGAEKLDLREDLGFKPEFDLILQHGTVEHIEGSLYIPFKNIHNACRMGGLMIHENPAKNNWPGHGQHYFTEHFYIDLAEVCEYTLLELTSEAAMGNVTDGWNVCAVLKKIGDEEFISEELFNDIYARNIKSS